MYRENVAYSASLVASIETAKKVGTYIPIYMTD